jgi:hypothetical protein
MKIIKLIAVALLAWLPQMLSAQLMLNGSFEQGGGVVTGQYYDGSIEKALYWENLNPTCDWVHPSTTAAGTPRTGVGCGRFGWNSSPSADEYCYGQTASLTAGATYVVSFWIRKDYFDSPDVQVGAHISPNVPTPVVTSPYTPTVTPQVVTQVTSLAYKKVSFCFTPAQTGTHYITFGSFKQNSVPYPKNVLVFLDDVSVEPAGAPPAASVTAATNVFCPDSPIALDGSASANETEYEWDIYDITNGNGVLKYDGDRQTGTATSIDAAALLGSNLIPGHCYSARLTVYSGCEASAEVQFCVVDTALQFITENVPVCENIPIDLEISGDNGWVYNWSTGQSGTGMTAITVIPTAPTATYTVTATTSEGCTNTQTLTLPVSSLVGQVPPTMNGINGTGEYIYYVHEGSTFSFTSTIFNNAGETVETDVATAANLDVITPAEGTNGGPVTFSGNASLNVEGLYPVTLTLKDNNACQEGNTSYTFIIKVICIHCPVCFDYENRTPQNNPLPSENRAAKCITVALTDPVVVGSGNHVLFQAGEYVDINNDNFDTDGGTFEALIEPTTCVEECNDCCENWTGFTFDPIPTYYIIDHFDDDPTNDYFQLTDSDHPLCAYNAVAWEIRIIDYSTTIIWMNGSGTSNGQCCIFKSPSIEFPMNHPMIWWDNQQAGETGHFPALDDSFGYELILYACNGQAQTFEGVIHYNPITPETHGMAQTSDSSQSAVEGQIENRSNAELNLKKQLMAEITLFPNPAQDIVTVNGLDNASATVQLFDAKGMVLTGRRLLDNSNSFSISALSAGTYYVRIYTNGTYVAKKLIKL